MRVWEPSHGQLASPSPCHIDSDTRQNYQKTIEQKYLLTFISGKDLWLMKLITCLMDYLTNEQVEIHP